jgi:hypothetical protein
VLLRDLWLVLATKFVATPVLWLLIVPTYDATPPTAKLAGPAWMFQYHRVCVVL